MPAAAHSKETTPIRTVMHVAFELGAGRWKLGFSTGIGRAPRIRTIQARDLAALEREIERARRRLGVAADAEVVSCYEAGRDGFWLHRYLVAQGIQNQVVDSSSIEVNRRKRQRKSDTLDVKGLLRLLARYEAGEVDVWKVVNPPSREVEDRRQLHREIIKLTEERTERSNRIHGLLATQGVKISLSKDFLHRLSKVQRWDGSPLGPELKRRIEREWNRRQRVIEEIDDLETERWKRLREDRSDPALDQIRALLRFKGIGIKSAWLFVMEFFSWREFRNQRQVGALAGLAPTPFQSGGSSTSPGIEKSGNAWVRRMATEIAWSWIRFQPDTEITRWFNERFAKAGKRARRRGIVAVARKMLIALWRYLEYGEIPDGAVLSGG